MLQSVAGEEQVKTAQAQVEAARGHLQSAEAQVAYSEVRSPISGVVADRPLNAGEMANLGSPLVTVMDISRVVARGPSITAEWSHVLIVPTAATLPRARQNHHHNRTGAAEALRLLAENGT